MLRTFKHFFGLVAVSQVLACEGEIGDSGGTWPMPTPSVAAETADAGVTSPVTTAEEGEADADAPTSEAPPSSIQSDASAVSRCGNGKLDDDEECDDALEPTRCKECKAVASPAECGNGKVEGDEECDSASESCDECRLVFCGDGQVQGDEECDDGNNIDDDECDNRCAAHVCGDGILQSGEQCDPPSDTCTTTCLPVPVNCGDGFVQTGEGEQCDDPNDAAGDGCFQCKFECGNGLVERQYGETCEPGRLFWDCRKEFTGRCVRCSDSEAGNSKVCERRDVCGADCQSLAACGDGKVDDSAGEQCEPPGSPTCDATCLERPAPTPVCGNGKREADEQCDPPDGRYCSADCRHTACGNGVREGAEECDPPNGASCSESCRVVEACVPLERPAKPLLLGDGSFSETLGAWRSDVPSQAQLLRNSAVGAQAPGALQVNLVRGDFALSSAHVLGATMCVPVTANTIYDFNASYNFPPSTPSAAGASVSLFLYPNATCSGSPIEPSLSRGPRVVPTTSWTNYSWTLDTGRAGSVEALSVRVRLDAWRPADVESVTVYWDDVQMFGRGSGEDEEPAFCGDCIVSAGEQCDDGNQTSGDGCNQQCLDECTTCQEQSCATQQMACSQLVLPGRDVAESGPRAGGLLGELCDELVECFFRTGCAGETAVSRLDGFAGPNIIGTENCYCGTAGKDCYESGKANGSCRAEIEAALETQNPGLILARMGGSDQDYPVFSAAVSLFDCSEQPCASDCGPGTTADGKSCGNGTLQDRTSEFLSSFVPGLFDSIRGDSTAACGELAGGACYPELGCGCFFEECDDGNAENGDGCDEQCFLEVCGNGVRQSTEACDDGNTDDGDGCDENCEVEWVCGDGEKIGNEACDDGNLERNDGCDDTCQEEICGNGVLQTHLGEQCDPPNGLSCLDGCRLPDRDECTACVLKADLTVEELTDLGLGLWELCAGDLLLDQSPAQLVPDISPEAPTCLDDPACLELWNCYVRTGCAADITNQTLEGACYCGNGNDWAATCLINDSFTPTGPCVSEMKNAYQAQLGVPATNTNLLAVMFDTERVRGKTSGALYFANIAAKSCLELDEANLATSRGSLDLGLCLAGVDRAERTHCVEACYGSRPGRGILNDDCTALE